MSYSDKLLSLGESLARSVRMDGWYNVLTGLGTVRDKSTRTRFGRSIRLSDQELTELYHFDDLAKRIIREKPNEMLRQGLDITISNSSDTDIDVNVKKKLKKLKVASKFIDAMCWGRLYGGAVIFIAIEDGLDPSMPINEDKIKDIKYLKVIDRRFINAEDTIIGSRFEEIDEPQWFTITSNSTAAVNITVHRSRLIFFGGAHTSDEERIRLGWWDYSILDFVYGPLKQYNTVFQAAEHLVQDAGQAVMKIKGLMDMISGGKKDILHARMEIVDLNRSVARMLMIDKDGEEFSRDGATFTALAEILDRFGLRLAAASEYPATVLLGRSPAGMNATGESDIRLFYDKIRTEQINKLKEKLEYLIRLIGISEEFNFSEFEISFKSLWQLTPNEQADLELKVQQKDTGYINAEVLTPEEVALSRFKSDGFNTYTEIDREIREILLKENKENLINPDKSDEDIDKEEESDEDIDKEEESDEEVNKEN